LQICRRGRLRSQIAKQADMNDSLSGVKSIKERAKARNGASKRWMKAMIVYKKGDIIAEEAEALVNPVRRRGQKTTRLTPRHVESIEKPAAQNKPDQQNRGQTPFFAAKIRQPSGNEMKKGVCHRFCYTVC
jgi:U3 small nucleolar RNA-associated protein 14